MSKGYLILAQSSGNHDYIKMAYALAMSIKITQKTVNAVAIAVEDKRIVPSEMVSAFDHIVEIPWIDDASESTWKIENKWKYVYMTPFEETVVLDADMVFTAPVDSWWDILGRHELYFTTNPRTYRNNVISSDFYRKTFTSNKLPDVYTAFMYFKKTDMVYDFFALVELIFHNWERYYYEFLDETRPKHVSGDVCYALAVKIMGIADVTCTNLVPGFVHMKTHAQDIDSESIGEDWTKTIPTYFTRQCQLKISNFHQILPFHYYVKDWLSDDVIKKLTLRFEEISTK